MNSSTQTSGGNVRANRPEGKVARWVAEHRGFLTVLSTAFRDNDIFTVHDVLERIAPAPNPDVDTVRVREKMTGDGTVEEYEVYDPKTNQLSNAPGPAVVKADGTRLWYYAGLPHNADGPAVIHPNGDLEFFYLGARYGSAEDLDATVKRAHEHAERSKNFLNVNGTADAQP